MGEIWQKKENSLRLWAMAWWGSGLWWQRVE
jgi:hypothetical protein